MTIREKGYTHWQGELKQSSFPWFPIMRYGIKLAFQKKHFKFFFLMTLVPAVIYLAGIYISERLEDFRFMISDSAPFIQITPAYFKSYFTNDFILFMLMMIMVFVGASLISDDLRHNALQMYFARPLKKMDYFIGKASILAFFILIVTLFPGIIFLVMKLVFSGSFRFLFEYPWIILSVLIYSFFLTFFFSCYTLLISSLSQNRRYAAILIFGIYFFSDILFGIFYGNFRHHYFSLLSLKLNLQQVGAVIFQQKTAYEVPWILSLLVLAAVCSLAVFVLGKRVKGVEIVK
ncbi:MAG: ABC transporter permease [Acidobacteriota bacterium]